MAIYHLHVNIISRNSGRSSVAAAAYRAGEKLHNERDGITHDYSKRNAVNSAAYRSGEKLNDYDFTTKRGVVYAEIILPKYAPEEFQDRATLWNAVEKSEKRCDAQTVREIDVALPAEFDRKKQIDITREYIRENFVNHGMIADFAIHDKGDGNPHAHIMLTTREVTQDGFGKKNRDWNKVEYLEKWRENWANICNHELERIGSLERIDHRTLAAQGFTREPTIHHGYSHKLKAKNDEIIRKNNAYINELKDGVEILKNHIREKQAESVEKERNLLWISENIKDISERYVQICGLYEAVQKDPHNNMLRTSYSQAWNYFEREYNITPDKTQALIERLKADEKVLSDNRRDFDIQKYSYLLDVMAKEYDKLNPTKPRPQQHYHEQTRERERSR